AVTGCSRVIYAFARDGGMPFSNVLKKVETHHHIPSAAIWFTVCAAFVALSYSGAYAVVTSISTISLYFSYTIPIYLSWRGRYVTPLVKGPWHLGRFSHTINLLAVLWTLFISFVLSMPNEMRTGKAMIGLIGALAAWYYFRERQRFAGPSWIG